MSPNSSAIDPKPVEMLCRAARERQTVFLASKPWCWNQVSGSNGAVVQLGVDDAFRRSELPDRVAVDGLRLGGRVYAVAAADVPGGADIAAVFRY